MKKIFTLIISTLATLSLSAQGWPAQYSGVMLQGFYWDSYADTKWTNLESQADELSQFFDLMWVPNSAYANATSNNMGYHPVYWFNHRSAFGTETQLRSMIQTFTQKGMGIIEDVVINHRASVNSNWLNFPAETYKGETYQLTAADICQDDEAKDNGYTPTGAKDTGEYWGGARDLDHSGANVQKNVNAYLDFLKNDLGYVGFRYDFVKGFAAKYVGQYNVTAQPQFSVGEYWDGNKTKVTNWINGTKQDGVIQSAAFDFPLKYYINDAFSGGQWSRLNGGCLADDNNYKRYSVTFVDNHDTGRFGECPLYANVEAANAYILTMPGTPCVWLSHWKTYKTAIKKQILIRKAAGIHNQSAIETHAVSGKGYVLKVNGTNGQVLLLLGEGTASTEGFKLALEGTNYKLYVTESVDLSALDTIQEETFTAPDFCTVNDGEICAFFEAPSSWTTVRCWAWNDDCNFTSGKWDTATRCTKVGTNNGRNVWKWTWDGKCYKTNTTTLIDPVGSPSFVIFHNGSGQQTPNLTFTNGTYYNEAGAPQGVVTGIDIVQSVKSKVQSYYDLQGRRVLNPTRGIYIVNGKKVVIK